MTAKDKERSLSIIVGSLALVILWLLLHKRRILAEGGGVNPREGDSYTGAAPSFGPININGAAVPSNTIEFHPNDVSFLFPQTVQHDDCSCGCDPLDAALAADVKANVDKFAQGLDDAEKAYIQGAYGDIPDFVSQYINNGDFGSQLNYPPAAPPGKGGLVFQQWNSSTKSSMRDKNIAGQGFWIDPATGAIVGTGEPSSDGTNDGKDDITPYGGETIEALSGYNLTGFQLVNGSHSNPQTLQNPSSWGS